MNKKTIISNTILFIAMVAFIIAFSAVFGENNTLIGVTTITAMLMLLERDLTQSLLGNTAKLIGLNLFIGIAAFLASLNMWLAIPINFTVMFIISYSLLYNLRNPLYLPFSLQYLFILAVPAELPEMPLRLASLAVGAVAIMAVQLAVNKNRLGKGGLPKIKGILSALTGKAGKIKSGESHADLDKQISSDISSIRSMIYDKREDEFFLTDEGQVHLNLTASLERINLLLNRINQEPAGEELLGDAVLFLQAAADRLDQDGKSSAEELGDSFSIMFRKYKEDDSHSLVELNMLNSLDSLKDHLIAFMQERKEHSAVPKQTGRVPKKFQKLSLSQVPGHTKSIKLSYAFRMALGISVGGFLADIFGLEDGRWMLFTILSVIQPIYELSKKKMRDRIFATVTGAGLVILLFGLFHGQTVRTALILLAGYLMSYIKAYRYNTILVTFSAIGSAALLSGTTEILTVSRILMVITGVVLALLINAWVFPYKMNDANEDLKEMKQDTIREMLDEIRQKLAGTGNGYTIKNLLIISTMIENKIKQNKGSEEDFGSLHLAPAAIFDLYGWIDKYKMSEKDRLMLSSFLEEVSARSASGRDLRDIKLILEREIRKLDAIEARLTMSLLLEIIVLLDSASA